MTGYSAKVGPHGYVRLVDWMGSDQRVVDAARISYGVLDEDRDHAADRRLLRYLMRHRHTSPFEQCELAFIVKSPMDVWRQWIRHRTANVNEYSTRYTEAMSEIADTLPRSWRLQAKSNRQGSDGVIDVDLGCELTEEERQLHAHARRVYERRVKEGVALEQARKDLPLSTYTVAYWKVDLHNLLHFLELRMDEHAQLEIRSFARTIFDEFLKPIFPLTAQAFLDYRFDAITLTAAEVRLIKMHGIEGALSHVNDEQLTGREVKELRAKIGRLTF